ncbi:NUDIX hydrolase [Arsenicibacter rosenii]|uniref:NUDIX hydrolase n=1 Tax=Arsenicibacter rosenii TaxID=1750698 RepID=A0A1S2VFA7_9BACT|nr:NUDIX hydrolase [Arsenicibacter rosenii]OIN57441.1 NUDIX hydrolase [Arsenicibacter rosenii]
MHREPLLTLLRHYEPFDENERAMWQETLSFVEQHPDCFERSLLTGHVTGSAWIVSPDRSQAVLIHHRKLDRWFQPGGHCDGDPDVAAVAMKEAGEETGLRSIRLVSPAIFDIDVHPIPAKGAVPAHLHYDIRFLLEADPDEAFQDSDETNDVKWVKFGEMADFTDSESILRMIRKKNS